MSIPPHPPITPDVVEDTSLTPSEQEAYKKFFVIYFKDLMPVAHRKWPRMTKEEREDAVCDFIVAVGTKKRKHLKEWITPEKQGIVITSFKNHQIDNHRHESVRAKTNFGDESIDNNLATRDREIRKYEAMNELRAIENYVANSCNKRDYLIFKMAFSLVGRTFSSREIGVVFDITDKLVNQRIYLIRRKLVKGGFLAKRKQQ